MTTRWRIFLVLVGLLALAALAEAEEPKGFLEWLWGTPQETLIEKFARNKCRDYHVFTEGGLKGDLSCSDYQIGDITIESVMLYFAPRESLAGYALRFQSRYRDMRQTIVDKLGKPSSITTKQYRTALGTSATGEIVFWRWPSGTAAQLSERCPEASGQFSLTSSCLQVSTTALEAQTQRKQQERQEERKKGF
jgi:hypothetical protein